MYCKNFTKKLNSRILKLFSKISNDEVYYSNQATARYFYSVTVESTILQ